MAFTTRHTVLGRIRLGEELGWEEFVDIYRPLVMLRARDRGLKSGEADDLMQDLMLELFKGNAVGRFDTGRGTRFRDYLRTIIDRCAYKIIKKRHSKLIPLDDDLDARDEAPGPADEFEAGWEAAWREHLFKQAELVVQRNVNVPMWHVYTRVVRQGAKAEDVAKELGVAANNVYVMKHRVLERMRSAVAELEGGEEAK